MLKVVIVEDEDIIRMGLVQTIDWQSMGAVIVGEAADGIEGLEVIGEQRPDAVLTDIKMPRLGGLEMAERLAEELPAVKIVFLTSYAEFEYAQQAIRLKAADYLLKPVDERALQVVLARLTAEKQSADKSAKGSEEGAGSHADWLNLGLVDWLEIWHNERVNIHVRRVLDRIAADYREHLSIEAIAECLQVSPSYLSRKLKEATGHTFGSLLARYRLQEAVKLLAEGNYRAYEVAELTGFGEYKNFCQVFKKYLHESPKRFMLERENKL